MSKAKHGKDAEPAKRNRQGGGRAAGRHEAEDGGNCGSGGTRAAAGDSPKEDKPKQKRLGEIERLTDRYRKEINELSLSKDENERKIGSLSRKLDTLREQRAAIIGLGQRRYEEIIGGGNTAEWKKADFEAAVEYGRTLMPDDIAAIEKSHRRLTPYNTFFLMLPLAGLSDSDIQRAMNMTAGAVRTMKYRLRRSPLNSPRGGA